jgi:HTH-type transcriptional repressor of NAD biosynthesis genes
VDTDAITTLFYSRFLLSDVVEKEICEKMATAISDMTKWDLVLFLEPDVAFIQDGTRNEVIHAEREKYSQQIKQALSENNIKYHCLSGDYLKRFEKAKQLIGDLGITTRF